MRLVSVPKLARYRYPRIMRLVWALLGFMLAAGAVAGVVVYKDLDDEILARADEHFSLPRAMGPAWVMRTIFLERKGGTITGGVDDSENNVSSILEYNKKPKAVIPPFKGSDATWKKFVACVRDKFAPFDIAVVDERPKADFVLTMVGGTPDLVGAGKNVTGLAPFNGEPIEDPVVFVFSRAMKENVRAMCETAAMEIAHAYGLDHEYLCKDPMTYLPPCGEKQFQNVDAPCGEKKKRPCAGGALTQNSYARLLEELGPAPTARK
jgi:hypothetical protein